MIGASGEQPKESQRIDSDSLCKKGSLCFSCTASPDLFNLQVVLSVLFFFLGRAHVERGGHHETLIISSINDLCKNRVKNHISTLSF